jgi:DtxR family Mn-dependent transcriptional regulator
MVTRAVEDYLKAIYKLQRDGSRATTNAIAESMGLRAASVTSMLQQLSEQGMVEYRRHRGAYLTEMGLEAALRVIRRHRLIELYLHEHLGVPWDRLHDEAERLEHAISPYLEERIDAKLGYPSFDPHGAPIPSSTGAMPTQDLIALDELPLHTRSVVRHIPDDDPDRLRYAASIGLLLEVEVAVTGRDPQTGAVSVCINGDSAGREPQMVSKDIAEHIFVSRPQQS